MLSPPCRPSRGSLPTAPCGGTHCAASSRANKAWGFTVPSSSPTMMSQPWGSCHRPGDSSQGFESSCHHEAEQQQRAREPALRHPALTCPWLPAAETLTNTTWVILSHWEPSQMSFLQLLFVVAVFSVSLFVNRILCWNQTCCSSPEAWPPREARRAAFLGKTMLQNEF